MPKELPKSIQLSRAKDGDEFFDTFLAAYQKSTSESAKEYAKELILRALDADTLDVERLETIEANQRQILKRLPALESMTALRADVFAATHLTLTQLLAAQEDLGGDAAELALSLLREAMPDAFES